MSIAMYSLVVVMLTWPSQERMAVELDASLETGAGAWLRVTEGVGLTHLDEREATFSAAIVMLALEDRRQAVTGDVPAMGVEKHRKTPKCDRVVEGRKRPGWTTYSNRSSPKGIASLGRGLCLSLRWQASLSRS